MYFIELLLTRTCNQKCYYCTTHKNGNTEVDIDFLKYVLYCLPQETGVEITGGEIGIIKNIDDVYKTLKDSPKIKHIIALSNGLLRKRGVDWIKDVEYWEHLIYDIKGKEIIKFYPELDLEQPHKYIIVTTKTTTKSLLNNWSYFDSMGMFRDNFFYKLMNHKSNTTIDSYYDDLTKLYGKLDNKYFSSMLIHYKMPSYLKDEKVKCEKLSPNPFIDLHEKVLGHCAVNVKSSKKFLFSKVTLNLFRDCMFNGDRPYCKTCYTFDYGKNRSKHNNRSYKR